MTIGYTLVETEHGWVGLAAGPAGLRAVTTPCESAAHAFAQISRTAPDAREPLPDAEAAALAERLRAYLTGSSDSLGVPLDLVGSPFQLAVWSAVAEIPRGETRTYGWIAERVGRPGAARAVGQAVGVNPIPLIVPCHRVIASGGRIGGYGGGLAVKRSLLNAEGASVRD